MILNIISMIVKDRDDEGRRDQVVDGRRDRHWQHEGIREPESDRGDRGSRESGRTLSFQSAHGYFFCQYRQR
jgi:hypothetical protein